MGARAPGRSAALKALRLVERAPVWAGAKAAAEPARAEIRASFIILIVVVYNDWSRFDFMCSMRRPSECFSKPKHVRATLLVTCLCQHDVLLGESQ
eukprot:scaffold4775_cov205-Skeletonema_menzelii.AAC.3